MKPSKEKLYIMRQISILFSSLELCMREKGSCHAEVERQKERERCVCTCHSCEPLTARNVYFDLMSSIIYLIFSAVNFESQASSRILTKDDSW
jgi:hypothetical protein